MSTTAPGVLPLSTSACNHPVMAFSFSASNPARDEAVAAASRAKPGAGAASAVPAATVGSALFDLPLSGYSLMQELAGRGRFVYAIDVRGYGASNGNSVMNSPPATHPPFSRTRHAVEDIGVAVSEIRRRQGVQSI